VKVKLQQKISGCWRTLAAVEAFLALRSYVSTAHKQAMNPLAVLRQLVESRPPATSPGRVLNSYFWRSCCAAATGGHSFGLDHHAGEVLAQPHYIGPALRAGHAFEKTELRLRRCWVISACAHLLPSEGRD